MKPKPLFGNAPVENKESKENMALDEKTLSSEETSAKRSLQIKTCSKTNVPLSDTKRNGNSIQEPFQEYKSLVSPRTLLNGTTTPLLGKGTVAGKKTTMNLFSPVLVNAPSRRDNGHSLVLCSTTVGCISDLPQVCLTFEPQKAVLGHTKDGTETDVSVETEEWHGCYDYEVLDGDDHVHTDLYEDYESLDTSVNHIESSLSNVSKYENSSILIPHQINVMTRNNLAKTVCVNRKVNTPKLEASSLTNNIRPPSLVCANEANASLANTSAPRSNSITSHHPKVVSSNIRLNVQDNSKAPQNKSRTGNSSSLITPKARVHERALVSNMCTKPTPVIIQHHATRPCLKKPNGTSSFIYSDTAETPRPNSAHSLRTPQSAISSNPMSRRSCPLTTTRSSLLHPSRPWPPRITAPLCGCGRRAKRQTVCNGGPNQGLGFYCCPVRRSGTGNMIQNGCKFFKWESSLIKDHSPANSCVQSSMSLHVLRCPQLSSTSRKSY